MQGYGPRIDAIVYHSDQAQGLTREEWIDLALAALDQAGVDATDQRTIRRIAEDQ